MELQRITRNRFTAKTRFLLGLALALVAFVLILLLAGVLGRPGGESGQMYSYTSSSTSTAEVTQPAGASIELSQGPESAYDFCETGSVVFNNAGSGNDAWLMLYRPQAAPASPEKVVMLAFDAKSMCSIEGQSRLCEPGILLESGSNVQVKGRYSQGMLLVRSVTAPQQ
jgi:hypothetical protein